tara:strand:+ start:35225 stop:35641 length:417 start_codon:yes stop_codon:yes gene_type:complete
MACLFATFLMFQPAFSNEDAQLEALPTYVGMIGFDSARKDFGDVAQGDMLEHTFLFMNNGLGPFEIKKASSGVSGVSVLTSLKSFETDELGEIRVRIDTSQMEGPQYIRVRVESDAHNAPSTLYVLANVVSETAPEEE